MFQNTIVNIVSSQLVISSTQDPIQAQAKVLILTVSKNPDDDQALLIGCQGRGC